MVWWCVWGAKTTTVAAAAVVFNRGRNVVVSRSNRSIPGRQAGTRGDVCVQYNKMAFSIERHRELGCLGERTGGNVTGSEENGVRDYGGGRMSGMNERDVYIYYVRGTLCASVVSLNIATHTHTIYA